MPTRNYPTGYKVPLHNVLLISCMDLRLLDNIIHFMEHENLINRYDQYIMAGASIGALVGTADADDELKNIQDYKGWETGLLQHVDLAIQLHNIKDIYILEHRNCGAYKAFLKDGLGDYEEHGYDKEFEDHKRYAQRLSNRLVKYLKKHTAKPQKNLDEPDLQHDLAINVHGFLMDIRGDVRLLCTTAPFME
ncbi:carbonic anhydrase [Spirosoma fluviale]|uniref:Carbonic anhydrase n=1 Tax=Spirosoma fluviale TaxID=1597977 RepID=A0A286GC45_9BACT|nr:carbonic anhydrase [Spirosoma fluviale]SOD92816.1 Carbonic anhydrase [Spirosoma fluviale]